MEAYKANRKILYVDDEKNLLSSFVSLTRKMDVETEVLNESRNIERVLIERGPFAVVLSDQRMPELDGVEVLERVRRYSAETVRVMVTGYADHNDTLRAINEGGISHYIAKPWKDDELRNLVEAGIEQYNLRMQNRFLLEQLDRENAKLNELLEGTVVGTARILGDMVGSVNPEGASQVERIRRFGTAYLNMAPEIGGTERWEIARALDLFNLGLAVLPPLVQVTLNKEGLAALDRLPIARNHHLLAAGLLKSIPRFEGVARIIELHRKDFDGSGVPTEEPIRGTDIPLGARLLHILVDLDKYTMQRVPGRMALSRMVTHPLKYDVTIIRRMLGEKEAPASESLERALPVTSLQAGMVLLDDVMTQNGQLLLRAGSVLSETALNILWQWHRNDPVNEPIRIRESQGG